MGQQRNDTGTAQAPQWPRVSGLCGWLEWLSGRFQIISDMRLRREAKRVSTSQDNDKEDILTNSAALL